MRWEVRGRGGGGRRVSLLTLVFVEGGGPTLPQPETQITIKLKTGKTYLLLEQTGKDGDLA